MPTRLLRAADCRRQIWKNGCGMTAEIWREEIPGGDFLWRLSMAEVASDGPFSFFPGIDRHILLIEGQGMILEHAGLPPHRLDRPFEPHAFAGDIATDCRLIAGPCRDLNLMIRRDRAVGRFDFVRLENGGGTTLSEQEIVALTVLSGRFAIGSRDGAIAAETGDTILVGGEELTLAATGPAIIAIASIHSCN